MIINNKLRTLFVLALYIGFTIAIYAIVCHFLKIEFQDIHLLYAETQSSGSGIQWRKWQWYATS